MKKKVFLSMMSGILATALLAGCGSSGSTASESTATDGASGDTTASVASATSEQSVASSANSIASSDETSTSGADNSGKTVKIAFSGDSITWQQAIIDQFEKDTGYTVEINLIPSNQDQYSKIMMLMTSPETCPDLIAEDGFMVKTDAAAGRLWALDDALADWEDMDQYDPSILEGGKGEDGKMYGLMTSTDTQILYYNKNLLKAVGIDDVDNWQPKTWDELLDVAKKLKEANSDKEDFIPLWIWASTVHPEETSMRTFQLFLSGTGDEGAWPSQLYDEATGKWVIDKEDDLAVLNFIDDAFNKSQVAETPSQAADTSLWDTLKSEGIKNGDVGMFISGSWEMAAYQENNQYPWPEAEEVIGYASLPTKDGQAPGKTTVSGGWTWAIPNNANNKEGGVALLKAICGFEGTKARAIYNGETSPRKDVAETEEYQNQSPSAVPYSSTQLSITHFRPSVDGYSSITTSFAQMIEDVAFGTSSPEDALNTLQSEMIRQFGEDKVEVK